MNAARLHLHSALSTPSYSWSQLASEALRAATEVLVTARPRPRARRAAGAPRVLVASDTVDEINGVAIGLRRLAARARRAGHELTLCGLGDGGPLRVDGDGIVRLPTRVRVPLPQYPQLTLGLPHLGSLVGYLADSRIDLVQCSTPGPMGLVALLAGRLAGLPVIGQFHTDVPEYATRLTGEPLAGAMAARFVGWFYRQLDEVLAPSAAVVGRLVELGVAPERVRRVPRGVDLDLFKPGRRNAHAFDAFGLNGEPKLLYVGRLSREKGLDALVAGFRELAPEVPAARLVFVGDGPYAAELARGPASAPELDRRVIFTGEITGERLAEMVASSDVFVYPSETETFGNAIVEAQAAGLPVIVANRGAARENVIDGVTGLVVDARDPRQLRVAMGSLLGDPARRRRMGDSAAAFAQRYDVGAAVRGSFALYAEIVERLAGTGTGTGS
jgi:glycosyltransferase involved in cell wall biosynthesis